MTNYILAVDCPLCGRVIESEGCMNDFTQPDGAIPVVTLNCFEQETFRCEHCDTKVYTADIDQMCEVEEGELPEDHEDDEYEDDESEGE